jgi:heat shock protein HtpX
MSQNVSKSLYTHRSENIFKTWLLMSGFFVVLLVIGYALASAYGNPNILYGFIGGSIVMNIVSYFFSDKIALAQSGAQPADMSQYRELHTIIENLAITAGLPKPAVYVISDPAPNAFATGRGPKNSAIAVTTGLLGMMDRSELEGVLAHELSHIGNRDILIGTVAVVLVGIISMVADVFMRGMLWGGRDDRENNSPFTLIIGIVLAILIPIIASIIQLAISRKREFLADASGAILTRYPEGLASALQKISSYKQPLRNASTATAHLYISNPFGNIAKGFANLFSTHPPTEKRIAALLGRK